MAVRIRGWLCPWMAGPQVQTKSISSRSSAVTSVAPCAALTKNGAPPTERNARTGELTPPGMSCWARAKSDSEEGMVTARSDARTLRLWQSGKCRAWWLKRRLAGAPGAGPAGGLISHAIPRALPCSILHPIRRVDRPGRARAARRRGGCFAGLAWRFRSAPAQRVLRQRAHALRLGRAPRAELPALPGACLGGGRCRAGVDGQCLVGLGELGLEQGVVQVALHGWVGVV